MILDVRQKIETYLRVFEGLKQDKRLLTFMQYILAVGNFMNQNEKRGGAAGYTFKALYKTAVTKTSDNKKPMLTDII